MVFHGFPEEHALNVQYNLITEVVLQTILEVKL